MLGQGQEAMNLSVAHYKMILRGIFDTTPDRAPDIQERRRPPSPP